MACGSCGKRKKDKRVFTVYTKKATDSNYIENQDGVTKFVYEGELELRAKGCASSHVYLFSPKREFSIDKNDFACFKERWPNDFKEVKNAIKSDNGRGENNPPKDKAGIASGDGSVYEDSLKGFSGDGKDLE